MRDHLKTNKILSSTYYYILIITEYYIGKGEGKNTWKKKIGKREIKHYHNFFMPF